MAEEEKNENVTPEAENVAEPEETVEAEAVETADNEFIGTGTGMGGDVKVKVTVDGGRISNVEVIEHNETVGIGDQAVEKLPSAIVEAQSTEVDDITGASVTSKAIKDAVAEALGKAGL